MIGIAHSVKMAVESLKSSKLRSALTMLGIIIGIAAVVATFTLGTSFGAFFEDQILSSDSSYVMVFSMQENLFFDQQVDVIRNSRSVTGASPVLMGSATITYMGEQRNFSVYGVTEDYAQMGSVPMLEGNFLSDKDTSVIVIGKDIAQDRYRHQIPIRGTVELTMWNDVEKTNVTRSFRVAGITGVEDFSFISATENNNAVYVPLSAMSEMTGINYYSFIFAMAESTDTVQEARDDIKRNLARNLGVSERHLDNDELMPFYTMSQIDFLDALNSIIGVMTTFLIAIGGISLVVGSVGIMNIMIVTVVERTREIGTLKALGYTSRDVLSVFLIESVVISAIGGTIGTVLGLVAAYVGSYFLDMPMTIQFSAVAAGILLSMVIGVIAGVYPARRAANMHPVDALRAI
jgi:putative ABC transport system permease protein